MQAPDLQDGLGYWESTPATLDGMLGGFGTGYLPPIDELGSRQFLMSLMPHLCTVPSVLRSLDCKPLTRRIRALDVGAGIGRVTSNVLLHLVDDVVLLEPINKFVRTANKASENWKGIRSETKSVILLTGPLQRFDPSKPISKQNSEFYPRRVGYVPPDGADVEAGFDVVWCQWALGHLTDQDLVKFLKQAKHSLRKSAAGIPQEDGMIVVKENLCVEKPPGQPAVEFDEEDSSLTRSNKAWLNIFKSAGLTVVRSQTQDGLPLGLFEVKMYALR